jgi:hypothetical protein
MRNLAVRIERLEEVYGPIQQINQKDLRLMKS